MTSIPLFLTEPSSCSYIVQQIQQSAFIHPHYQLDTPLYSQLIEQGFRRSGNEVYAPYCPNCSQCIASRIPVKQFTAKRNQQRCWKKNQHTTATLKPAQYEQAHYELYIRYQQSRHEEGGMARSSAKDYIDFLASDWCNTLFVEFAIENQLVAVAVVDLLDNALSAVYTFFDPQFHEYSLGTYAVLWQIERAKHLNLDFVYLGFWIKNCQKMSYKMYYHGLQGLIGRQWQTVTAV